MWLKYELKYYIFLKMLMNLVPECDFQFRKDGRFSIKVAQSLFDLFSQMTLQ